MRQHQTAGDKDRRPHGPTRFGNESRLDMAVMLLLLVVSGNPAVAFPAGTEATLVAVTLLLIVLVAFQGFRQREAAAATVFTFFLLINLAHGIVFHFFPVITVLGWFVRLFIAYAASRLIRSFAAAFVRAMTWLGILSLVFWGLGLVGVVDIILQMVPPYSVRSTGNAAYTILIHTFHTDGGHLLQRNCGFFWEPGAFAGYLLLAIFTLSTVRNTMTRQQFSLSLAVLLACLASTISTMGYIVLPIAMLPLLRIHWTPSPRLYSRITLVCLALPFLVWGTWEVWKLEFMSTKIEWQYDMAEEKGATARMSRFGAAQFDWEYIRKRPMLGWGMHSQTRFLLHPQFIGNPPKLGNGFTAYLARFGFGGLLLFLVAVWKSSRYWLSPARSRSFLLCLLLILTLQSENFLGYPLYMAFMFLPGRGRP